jgi:DNA-binding response OmpR family regulator
MANFQITMKRPASRRVLVADDDPVMTLLLTASLKRQECEVVVAQDGREAYRILQTDAEFCAAIIDMTMPFLEGLDLIRYMQSERRLKRIPVMMISAGQDIKLMATSFSAGATAFLPKPFSPDQLQSAIRMLLGRGSSHRRAA